MALNPRVIKTVIDLVSVAVRTAPKSGGVDDVFFMDATRQKTAISREMRRLGKAIASKKTDHELAHAITLDWASDADTVQRSDGLILIGVDGKHALGANCGGCGFKDCAAFNKNKERASHALMGGPFCTFKILDLGIALGSAVETLSDLHVDNRIMYKIGVVAGRLKLAKADPLIGIPLSVTGKNIYFDRMEKLVARAIFNKQR